MSKSDEKIVRFMLKSADAIADLARTDPSVDPIDARLVIETIRAFADAITNGEHDQ